MKLLEPQAFEISDKIKNICFAFLALVLYTLFAKLFLAWLFDYPEHESLSHDTPLKIIIFFSFIAAPLWEELAFRVIPIQIAKALGKTFDLNLLIYIIPLSSIIFGWGHGYGPISLIFQGVAGIVLSLVYIKNDYSYLSVVALHSMWNIYAYHLS